jgi:hypothetical protein
VLEGSHVELELTSVNKKPLREVWLTAKVRDAESGDKVQRIVLAKTDSQGLAWKLPQGDSPFNPVTAEVRYEIQVTDIDGLHLEAPLAGVIRIQPDRPPSGAAMTVSRVVLPRAAPELHNRVLDDYGISQVQVKIAIERAAITATTVTSPFETSQSSVPGVKQETETVTRVLHPATDPLLLPDRLPFKAEQALELSSLNLVKGDRLKLTMEITDFRGNSAGQTYLADPLVLEVSDESGVLAAISEADPKLGEGFTDVINKQTGSGDSP